MWRIGWAPNNASKWQMGFKSAFKGLMLYMDHIFLFHQIQSCEGHKFWSCIYYCFCFIMKVFLFVCSVCGVHKMNIYRGDQAFLFLCLHDAAGEPRDRVWWKLYVIHNICVLIKGHSSQTGTWINFKEWKLHLFFDILPCYIYTLIPAFN
jgi:hypothetical protein